MDRLLTILQVTAQAGLGRTRILELEAEGRFPRRVEIGRAVRWSEQEVQAWIAERIRERDARAAASHARQAPATRSLRRPA